jgi:predicted ABC-type ATPase
MASRKSSRPTFWLIAGPNGSGKSTLYGSERAAIYGNAAIVDFARPFWITNPDMLALRIRSAERMGLRAANLEAVKRIETWLEASINAHQSVGVERVLSTSKYRRLVRAAKRRRFEIRLVYVVLRTPALNVERVRLRVKKGGHSVPINKITERWKRSLKQLPWFLRNADWALLFDNSDVLRPIGRKERGTVILDPGAPVFIRRAIEKIRRTGRESK